MKHDLPAAALILFAIGLLVYRVLIVVGEMP